MKIGDPPELNLTDVNPLIFTMSFIFVVKRLMTTKNSVVETQNLAMNHKSRPVKSNPVF